MKRVGPKRSGERERLARCVARLAQHTLKALCTGRLFGEALALPNPYERIAN